MKKINQINKLDIVNVINSMLEERNVNSRYRAYYADDTKLTISNVPEAVYRNQELKKYTPPSPIDKPKESHILFLHKCFNHAHHHFQELCERHEDGKCFHNNQCHDNSLASYFVLHSLANGTNFPIMSKICICFGYISKMVKPGAVLGDTLINFDGLTIHDWHAWNKINDFIIDITISKNAGDAPLGYVNKIWKNAEDHIFCTHPQNVNYFGIDFDDHLKFINFTKRLFSDNQ